MLSELGAATETAGDDGGTFNNPVESASQSQRLYNDIIIHIKQRYYNIRESVERGNEINYAGGKFPRLHFVLENAKLIQG